MISIITAVHNLLPMNRLFFKSLWRYTRSPHELIIIDNCSNDGTREFFKNAGGHVRVIENEGNYGYAFTQNQGIKIARYDTLAFLNNDIIVAPGWDERLRETMNRNNLDIVTPCGIERLENRLTTRMYDKKWMWIKSLIGLLGYSETNLKLMHRMMYGNWERFTERRFRKFGYGIRSGIAGHSVVMRRSALDKVGIWDERIGGADHDLYARAARRSRDFGDLRPVHVALGIFHHHYVRLTFKALRPAPPAKGQVPTISMEEKWREDLRELTSGIGW